MIISNAWLPSAWWSRTASSTDIRPATCWALLACSGVLDAAVLSVSDESRGEALVACLVAQDGVTRERVMAHLRGQLAPYKIPRRLVFLKELPRGARGKIDVEGLRREALRAGDD